MTENLVLLLKAPKAADNSDPYEKALTDEEFQVKSVPVLGFSFINIDNLAECLYKPDNFSSVVLTSQRAAEAINIALSSRDSLKQEWNTELKTAWSTKPCYVVGNATAGKAQETGFTVQGDISGNAEKLAHVIIQGISDDTRPVLFPCGNLKRETIPAALKDASIPLTSITVYETSADSSIKDNLEYTLKNQGVPEYIVFYSPSGVNYTLPILKDLHTPLENIKIIAIGPTTETALLQKSLTVDGTCEKPTPVSLVQTLLRLKNTL